MNASGWGSRKVLPSIVLLTGLVLIGLGGEQADANAGSFLVSGWLADPPSSHTATLLTDGRVLVAGGQYSSALASARIYDPAAGTWVTTGSMTNARVNHTATLLPNCKILVAGGDGGVSAEIYDPDTGQWARTGNLNAVRNSHTATLLASGKVLVVGGYYPSGHNTINLASTEIFDPATGAWAMTGSMATNRSAHTATLLPNGKVLVAGGAGGTSLVPFPVATCELYDPETGTWTATSSLSAARRWHTATLLRNGKVAVTGGRGVALPPFTNLATTELYDPMSETWTMKGSLNMGRYQHTATLLTSGKLLVAGGYPPTPIAELYDPGNETWTTNASMSGSRSFHTATMLPSGDVLMVGGGQTSSELYRPGVGTWTPAAPLAQARSEHTATLLNSGKVLVTGGFVSNSTAVGASELFDPASGAWRSIGDLNSPRCWHTATLLANGKVLVAGGANGTNYPTTAELYDPDTETWAPTGLLGNPRDYHSASLLPNGKVVVAGGRDKDHTPLSSVELYDPATGNWTALPPMQIARAWQTAVNFPGGRVMVFGGFNTTCLSSTETYDFVTRSWTWGVPMMICREKPVALLLPGGKVLVAAGYTYDSSGPYSIRAELFDPNSGTWSTITSSGTGHGWETATVLSNGQVLLAGGIANAGVTNKSELFDPATGGWTVTGNLNTPRNVHIATLLLDGRVLETGGFNYSDGYLASAEMFDPGLGYNGASQPRIGTTTTPLDARASLMVSGTGFRGVTGGSSGNAQDSPADYPLVQLRSLGTGQSLFVRGTNWSTNTFASVPVNGFAPGQALVTVYVNGTPSTGSVILVNVPVPTPPVLTSARTLTNGGFGLSFTNTPGALFGVLTTTNLELPLCDWTPMGRAEETAPGQFRFTDPQATNGSCRFYRIQAP